MASNYPPGVSGNEPQITGEINPDAIAWTAYQAVRNIEDVVDDLSSMIEDSPAPQKWADEVEAAWALLKEALGDVVLQAEDADEVGSYD